MATASRSRGRPRFPLAFAVVALLAAGIGFVAASPEGRAWAAKLPAFGGAETSEPLAGAPAPAAPPRSAPPPPAAAPLPADAVLVAGGFVDVEGGDRKLAPGIPGIVEEVLAPEGTRVAEGAPLLKLRARAAEQDCKLAQAAIDQADKRLAMARKAAPLRESRGLVQDQAVQGAAVALRNAEDSLRQYSELDQEARTEAKLKSLTRLVEGARAKFEAESQLRAQLDLDDPNDAVALAAAEITKARAALAKAQEQLDLHTLLAPEAGRVLRVFVGKGAATGPAAPPAMIFLPDRPPIVRCEVGQEFSRRVAEGQRVEVRPDVLDGAAWGGRMLRIGAWIGPRRAPLDEPLERNDVRTLECIVAFDDPPAGLRHGERVRVTVLGGAAPASTRAASPVHQAAVR